MMIEKYNVQNVHYLVFKYINEKDGLRYVARVTVWKTGRKYSVFVYFEDGTENDWEKQNMIFNNIKEAFAIVKEYKEMIANI